MFRKGQLIRWYETYGDVLITKDAGLGVVVSKHEYIYNRSSVNMYKIYRIKYKDYYTFEEQNIQTVRS